MSVLGIHKKIAKEKAKRKRKEWEKRAKAFYKAYDKLVKKHKMRWKPILEANENGVLPKMRPEDITEQVEKAEEDEGENEKG